MGLIEPIPLLLSPRQCFTRGDSVQRGTPIDGTVNRRIDAPALANCPFSLRNIRFFQFIADDGISLEESDFRFQQDLEQLTLLFEPS